jgi:tight adherence protein D
MSSHRFHRSVVLALSLTAFGTGCVTERGPAYADPEVREALSAKDEPRLHLELIEKMLEGGRAHAALAHLDALEPEAKAAPSAQLLRAEALRRMGQTENARRVYESLLVTEAAAPAWRGLALIKVDQGDLATAVDWLRKARDLQPTAARYRNDLGYALILRGDLDAAKIELVTALELDGAKRAARNLVLLMLLQGDDAGAERLARAHELDDAALERLRQRADRLRGRIALRGGA